MWGFRDPSVPAPSLAFLGCSRQHQVVLGFALTSVLLPDASQFLFITWIAPPMSIIERRGYSSMTGSSSPHCPPMAFPFLLCPPKTLILPSLEGLKPLSLTPPLCTLSREEEIARMRASEDRSLGKTSQATTVKKPRWRNF